MNLCRRLVMASLSVTWQSSSVRLMLEMLDITSLAATFQLSSYHSLSPLLSSKLYCSEVSMQILA